MNRRKFFKGLGLITATTVIMPKVFGKAKEKNLPIQLGADKGTFLVKSNNLLKVGDILTTDPLYGQQVMVITKERKLYSAEVLYGLMLVTNNKYEYISSEYFNGSTLWYKLRHQIVGEYSSFTTNIEFDVKREEIFLELADYKREYELYNYKQQKLL